MGTEFIIGTYCLDIAGETLHGDAGPMALGTRGIALLRALAEANGTVVSKAALMDAAWPGLAVEESNLTVQIAALRRVLGDGAIATAPRRGYRLALAITRHDTIAAPAINEPSIAVLPLSAAGDNERERYFADGITHEIIVALSRSAELRVIAANSSLIYRQGDVDLDRAARELRIGYALMIGVQRDADQVRISARLIDTATRAHLWAERFDRDLRAIFAVQDEIAERISGLLVSHVARAERERAKRKPPASLVAYDYYLRAMDQSRIWHKADFAEAERMLRQCLALEPNFAPALAALSGHLVSSWIEPKGRADWAGWDDHTVLESAIEAARTAVERDPYLPQAHAMLGWSLFWRPEHDVGIASFRRALELDPGLVDGRFGFMLAIAGFPQEGMQILLRTRSLDPFHPPFLLGWIGACHLLLDQPEEALHALQDCVARAPLWRLGHLWLAATCSRLGLDHEARRAASVVLAIDPTFTVAKWSRLHGFRDVARVDRIRSVLIRAGVPEGDVPPPGQSSRNLE